MHVVLSIDNGLLIGNDVPELWGKVNERESVSKIAINLESKEEAERMFDLLSEWGEIEVPIGDSSWNSCFGMFQDNMELSGLLNILKVKRN